MITATFIFHNSFVSKKMNGQVHETHLAGKNLCAAGAPAHRKRQKNSIHQLAATAGY